MSLLRFIFRPFVAVSFFLLALSSVHAQVTNVTGDQAPPWAMALC